MKIPSFRHSFALPLSIITLFFTFSRYRQHLGRYQVPVLVFGQAHPFDTSGRQNVSKQLEHCSALTSLKQHPHRSAYLRSVYVASTSTHLCPEFSRNDQPHAMFFNQPACAIYDTVYLGVQWRRHPGHDWQGLRRHLLGQPTRKPSSDRGDRFREDLQDGGQAHGARQALCLFARIPPPTACCRVKALILGTYLILPGTWYLVPARYKPASLVHTIGSMACILRCSHDPYRCCCFHQEPRLHTAVAVLSGVKTQSELRFCFVHMLFAQLSIPGTSYPQLLCQIPPSPVAHAQLGARLCQAPSWPTLSDSLSSTVCLDPVFVARVLLRARSFLMYCMCIGGVVPTHSSLIPCRNPSTLCHCWAPPRPQGANEVDVQVQHTIAFSTLEQSVLLCMSAPPRLLGLACQICGRV